MFRSSSAMMGCSPDWSSVQHDEPAQPSQSVLFYTLPELLQPPTLKGLMVRMEWWWNAGEGHKIKARFLSEPSLLLQTSRCLYCSFTMFPLCMYSFPARLLKHPHTTAFQAPRLLGEAPALAPFLSRPPASTPHPALRFNRPPPRMGLPVRPPCLSRFVPTVASPCNAPSLTM